MAHQTARVRGVAALVTHGGRTLEIPTAGVVVDIYADDPRLAAFAKPGQAGVVKILLRGKNQRGEIVQILKARLVVPRRGAS